jgi:hypothetical protein
MPKSTYEFRRVSPSGSNVHIRYGRLTANLVGIIFHLVLFILRAFLLKCLNKTVYILSSFRSLDKTVQ